MSSNFPTIEEILGLNGRFIDRDSRETYDHFMRLFDTNSFRLPS